MRLLLEQVAQKVGAVQHLYPLDLALQPGAVTVLLGATQAGKTSLMRVMAGLDKPTAGRVTVDGADVTGMPVRERNVAMVYQQFINYPSMSVADNIASPLKLRGGMDRAAIDARVRQLAGKLHIEPFLARLPAELSGGQQQRVALARALAKDAPLMLLDEPLVNLDYKLREELREELTQLFAAGDSTVVYATTEPGEALLLGGWTAVLDAGELLQYGRTAEVFHAPTSLRVARAFSDPPMNLIAAEATSGGLRLRAAPTDGAAPAEAARTAPAGPAGGGEAPALRMTLPASASRELTVGIRAAALRVRPRDGDIALPATVELAEISGSDTFVHARTAVGELVAQLTGVHDFELGAPVVLHADPAQAYVFGADGALLVAPERIKRA
ncbi:MAG TPA: ABC transporter ATP-binding protein [Methylibium sp.]|uniref:ABC transporter ATP-binding protein n=1 Tax=Methylibium sp. TaxID=2067992 RepID=UPI002DB74BD5|nr:ABC transporter ATP-binding protein [Methylibium sp.]HEU4458461.1 ABC transporter ATP-binding protein [Methylibium sp.]